MGLREFRGFARQMVHNRDIGLCRLCLHGYIFAGPDVFPDGPTQTSAQEVHHVFGRSRTLDWREYPMALVSVCRNCHPAPLYLHDWSSDHWIVRLMHFVNQSDGLELIDGVWRPKMTPLPDCQVGWDEL